MSTQLRCFLEKPSADTLKAAVVTSSYLSSLLNLGFKDLKTENARLSVEESHLQHDWAALAMRHASQLLSTGQITANVQTLLAELRSRLQVVSDRTAELVILSENLDVSSDAAASAEVNRLTAMPKSVHANLKAGDLEAAIEILHEWGQKRLIPNVGSLPATIKWRDEVDEEMKLAFDCVLDAIVASPDQQAIGVILLLETLLQDQDAVARAYVQSLEKAAAGMRFKMLVTHDGSLRVLASVSRFTARIAEMVASCENLLPDKRALYAFANRELAWLLWYVGDLLSGADLADPTSIAHIASFSQAEGQTSPELEALGLSISQDLDSILLDFLLKAAVHTMEPTLLKFRLLLTRRSDWKPDVSGLSFDGSAESFWDATFLLTECPPLATLCRGFFDFLTQIRMIPPVCLNVKVLVTLDDCFRRALDILETCSLRFPECNKLASTVVTCRNLLLPVLTHGLATFFGEESMVFFKVTQHEQRLDSMSKPNRTHQC